MELYITERRAAEYGFTHHGKYFGIPVWMTVDGCPMVAAKFAPCEYLITVGHYIEGFIRAMRGMEPGFQFLATKEIPKSPT